MKKLLTLILLFQSSWLLAQRIVKERMEQPRIVIHKGEPIVCYGSGISSDYRVPPPAEFLLHRRTNARTAAAKSKIVVVYSNNTPPEARAATQYAAEIWQSLLVSSVPIYVAVNWSAPSSSGALAATGADYATLLNFQGAPKGSTLYPSALAEKLLQREITGAQSPDILIQVNPSPPNGWYYGLDGNTPAGRYDFVSTILHEMAHGLGFTGSFAVNNTTGLWGQIFGTNTGFPAIFDRFVENADGVKIVEGSIENNSAALRNQLTGQNLFFAGPLANTANLDLKSKLYAPRQYSSGSSIYHLDEVFSRTPNALMTFQASPGESIFSPGPVTLGILNDMGWKTTYIRHNILGDSEEPLRPSVFTATVTSDTTLIPNSIELTYFVNNFNTKTTVKMTPSGKPDEYQYSLSLPSSTTNRTIGYYISAQDRSGRTFSVPAQEPQRQAGSPNVYVFQLGTDTTVPTITHEPVPYLNAGEVSKLIVADITDDFTFLVGQRYEQIDTAYVEFDINGTKQAPFGLPLIDSTGLFMGTMKFPAGLLKGGETITYKIIARDLSKAKNLASVTNTFKVTTLGTAVTTYESDFNTPNNDFFGVGFSITTPSGFTDPAIHSDHPYKDGTGIGNESNSVYQLLKPIIVGSTEPYIRFDEIVLVEPGESGAAFGDPEFYDYVIVEGSKDNGATWIPFRDGYDSNDKAEWLTAYNKTIDQSQNSTSVGTPSLYRKREITLVNNSFRVGDRVLIRFRLFSDQAAHGWGWAIDNLRIQLPPITSVALVVEPQIKLFPNPSTGTFVVEPLLRQSGGYIEVSVTDLTGHQLHTQRLANDGTSKELDLNQLPAGVYLINLQSEEAKLTKRVAIVK